MKEKPNIVFIVADDLNAWIEPLGRHPQVKTPNINRLTAERLRLKFDELLKARRQYTT